jgi:hypothetical protein
MSIMPAATFPHQAKIENSTELSTARNKDDTSTGIICFYTEVCVDGGHLLPCQLKKGHQGGHLLNTTICMLNGEQVVIQDGAVRVSFRFSVNAG